jgi:hypothetical protein
MNDLLPLGIACGDCARTKALHDGRLSVESYRVNYIPLEPEEVFSAPFKIRNSPSASCRSSAPVATPIRTRR